MGTVWYKVQSNTACAKPGGQLTQHLPCCLCARSTMSLSPTTEYSLRAELHNPDPGILTDTPDPNLSCYVLPTNKWSHWRGCRSVNLTYHWCLLISHPHFNNCQVKIYFLKTQRNIIFLWGYWTLVSWKVLTWKLSLSLFLSLVFMFVIT